MLLLIVIGAAFVYAQNNWLQVTKYTVASAKIPESFDRYTIVQLSDLHSHSFGQQNQRLIRKINKIKPDLIVTTGDMLNSVNDTGDVSLQLLEQLTPHYPVYYVSGNHEQIAKIKAAELGSESYNRFMERMEELGVVIMDDEKADITINNESIHIYGYILPLRFYKAKDTATYIGEKPFSPSYLDESAGEADAGGFNILLTHNPMYFNEYADWGADLTMAGHMHGGIIRIPFVGGVLSPERAFFPEYDAGLFTSSDSVMIVNRGLGNETIKLRIFNRPELSIIELRSE
ncbi:phosphohydrolase [Paenibacillus sp. J2TS4]|nr:phosphohydrolase [Paenibacillus sp. J2TS4]